MFEQSDDKEGDATDLSESIVEAVESDQSKIADEDTLSKREKKIESDKEQERILKARELKKQLRKRELGILRYRWPTAVLIISGIMAISTEFLPIWEQASLIYGFNTYWNGFLFSFNVFWLFPIVSGAISIIAGYFAYTNPKATFLGIVPAMLMAMAGSQVYFLIELVVSVDPNLQGAILATGTPLEMLILALVSLLAIAIREKE